MPSFKESLEVETPTKKRRTSLALSHRPVIQPWPLRYLFGEKFYEQEKRSDTLGPNYFLLTLR